MIGEKLQRNHGQHGLERLGDVRHVKDLFAVGPDVVIALGGHRDDVAAPGADLLDVGDHLLVLAVAGGDEDHRHAVVDQGDRAVLHLRRGHPLGVDVADLLELESPLEGDGVVVAPAEEEPVLAFGVLGGDGADLLTQPQHPLDGVGHRLQPGEQPGDVVDREEAAAADEGGEHGRHHEVAQESLRRGYADLGSHPQVDARVGVAGHG